MIYLDNAATTALDSPILDKMLSYFSEIYGNASSVHSLGRDARMAVERARQQVATAIGAQAKDIVFTSSATEANNLAIKGVLDYLRQKRELDFLPEIVANPTEHPCVIESLKHFESLGWAKIVWLPVDAFGRIAAEAVQAAITERTVLVSVMYVNNEIGTVQPVQEIGSLVRKTRWSRLQNADERTVLPLYFHCDAVQAIQYFECDVQAIGVDLLSMTGHKLYGPKGAGVLYMRDGVQISRQIDGGGQEYYKRAGTENVAGIVGMGEALAQISRSPETKEALVALQQKLRDEVLRGVPDAHLTGHPEYRAPHITSFIFEKVDGEALITALDREGIAVSSGSACSSGVVRQSHVIEALPLSGFDAHRSAALRVSTSKYSTEEEIQRLITALPSIIAKLRELNL